jgi:hypothetical protein
MTGSEVVWAGAAKELLAKAAPSLLSKVAQKIGRNIDQIKVQFSKTFQAHIAESLSRSRQVKTILSKDKAVSLEEIYVPLTLSCNGEPFSDEVVNPTDRRGKRVVISGTGGSGKTFLMKHMLNLSEGNSQGFIPLFFELRTIEFDEKVNLHTSLYKDMKLSGAEESFQLFEIGLQEGLFALYLDGFDEIKPELQSDALKKIDIFSRSFPECSIIISTRPKTGAEDLVDFDTYHMSPLDKIQALAVVQKTAFDKVTKDKFYKALDEFLYDRHKTMMSIPILVAMMLLTFRSYSDIPDRMTVFYAQAYNTLYAIHDSEHKLQFKREYRSKLAPDIFRKVIEAFCFLSLKNHDIEFTHNSFMDYIGKAIRLTNVDCDIESYSRDLLQNVCIVQPDGISFVFVHRSFQEYFAACFALNYSGESQFEIMDQISDNLGNSASIMMDEIDNAKFRRIWLVKKLDNAIKSLEEISHLPISERIGYYAESIVISQGKVVSIFFGGGYNSVVEQLESVSVFFEDVEVSSIFINRPWFSQEAEEMLAELVKKEPAVFSLEAPHANSVSPRYKVNFLFDAESWLSKTQIEDALDDHLSRLISARQQVRDFVDAQDHLETELLKI